MKKTITLAWIDQELINEHLGHDIRTFYRYDKSSGIECVDCQTDFIFGTNEQENN